MPDVMPSTGVFMLGRGIGAAVLFVVLHIAYGATVGGLYRTSLVHSG